MNLLTIGQAWGAAAFEIIIMLLIAFLLGLLLGYLIWNKKRETNVDFGNQNNSVLKTQKSSLEANLKNCQNEKSNLNLASASPQAASAPATKDELKKIEGIGPKIQELFYENGIYSFAQMASTPSSSLKEILNTAGPRMQMHDPTSWPSQAKLAADGKWDELNKLQDELKGGK